MVSLRGQTPTPTPEKGSGGLRIYISTKYTNSLSCFCGKKKKEKKNSPRRHDGWPALSRFYPMKSLQYVLDYKWGIKYSFKASYFVIMFKWFQVPEIE